MNETPRDYIKRLIRSITDDATIAAFVSKVTGERLSRNDVAELRREVKG